MRSRMRSGQSLNSISKATGIQRSTLRDWRDHPERDLSDHVLGRACPLCANASLRGDAYAYLLGMYLGDGCVSTMRGGVFSLRVACDLRYRAIIAAVAAAICCVKPGATVHHVRSVGCVHVTCFWKHWPCVFPQHGPGRKHERPIALTTWQQHIVAEHPGHLLRGLFHSDGCRITNWTVRTVAGSPKRYEYPRYLFSNESSDILRICTDTLDALAIRWTQPRRNMISVARRDSVALLDVHVGPKT